MTCISAAASALFTPWAKRPMTSSWLQPRSLPEGFFPSMAREGVIKAPASGALGKVKPAGRTPTTV
jgi:hypothetical protein